MQNEEIQNVGCVQQESQRGMSNIDRATPQFNQSNRTIRYFSMFSGVGGFEVGLESANNSHNTRGNKTKRELSTKGKNIIRQRSSQSIIDNPKSNALYQCIGMSEIDKYSNQVLKYKFPTIKNWGDCTKINPNELPDFDMLCGGFPCQSFSIAGKRRGFEDTRGTMFFEIARILKIKRPKIILLENVKGLLNHNKGETFSVILETLAELGYSVQWMVLNSKFFGVPQNRERIFIIGSLRGTSRPEILPFGEGSIGNDVKDCSATITSSYRKGCNNHNQLLQLNNPIHSNNRMYGKEGISPSLNTAQGGNRQPKIRAVGVQGDVNKRKTYLKDEIGTLAANPTSDNTARVTDGYSIRRLTPTEYCRLQGFPDDWNEWGIDEKGEKVKMSDTQRYKQMGNAVTTNVIKSIGERKLSSP